MVAPTSGVLERRFIESGEHVARGAQLFTLVRTDALEFAATIPARYASNVRTGQITRFNADGRSFEGRVVVVSPTIDPATRSITVYVQVQPVGHAEGWHVRIRARRRALIPQALVIPGAGVRQAENGSPYVYTIEGEIVAQQPVQIGIVDDATGIVEITSGLEEGDRVIVGNVGTLGKGMQVRVVDRDDRPVRR